MGKFVIGALGEDETDESIVITPVPETHHPASAEANPKVISSETLKKANPGVSLRSSDKLHVASEVGTIKNQFVQERPSPPFPQRIKKENDALNHPNKGMEYCYFVRTFDTLVINKSFLIIMCLIKNHLISILKSLKRREG
ncbi:hypothetical protein TSUD_147020 [Trifolium subterraneum]|uniref:Uncharacterized protein n=1 Tax=Trifolium subterraneum TaxID=3900 RepID=A0A2Z6MK39_TRISU|nr:hypothetical protein TSUD_147020 [Trifolium subterraneum]